MISYNLHSVLALFYVSFKDLDLFSGSLQTWYI